MKNFVVLLLAGGLSFVVLGQEPQAKPALPAYDVVSVKPGDPTSNSHGVSIRDTRYFATNSSVRALLADAYGVKQDAIFDIPKALEDAVFDVDARVLDTEKAELVKITDKDRQAMLAPVLADRFKLLAHKETRTLPIYELVVASDGLKLKQTSEAETSHGVSIRNRRELEAHRLSMARLADVLSNQLRIPVIDKTGLAGEYSVQLKWSLEEDTAASSDAAPLIFTALQEQLGLKLRSAKGPVEVLVVERMEMPSAN